MTRKRPFLLATALSLSAACLGTTASTAAAEPPVYRDSSYAPAERAADLVSRMTVEEKAQQLTSSQAPAIPRLGVKAYGWWNEAIHGVSREQTNDGDDPPDLVNTTSYPTSLSMGATWDPELVHEVADQVSSEAREVVRDNRLDLNFYSPTVNLGRDPRWGRNDETYGEDPKLTAELAAQYVNGMEGKDRNGELRPDSGGYLKTSTTIKHFAANNSEYNRTTGSSDMDESTLRQYYAKPFEEVLDRTQPGSIMTAYNRVNGVPATASTHLVDTLARKTFGFRGFFTTDCDSAREMQHGHHWQPPGRDEPVGPVERNAYANAAGVDLNCNQGLHDEHHYGNTLPTAAERGTRTSNGAYTEHFLDASLVRMFTTRIRLGEFDSDANNPWVQRARERVPRGSWENSEANEAVTQTDERLDLARRAGSESLVLLQNDPAADGEKVLPLDVPRSGPFRVAVVGDYANPEQMYLGGYSSEQGPSGRANNVNGFEGVKRAIKRINPQATVDYLPGTDPQDPTKANAESIRKAANYDTALVYAGTDDDHAEEEKDRGTLQLPEPQTDLIEGVAHSNPNTAVYLETVGAVDVTRFADDVPAILWSSYNGQRKGQALADVLTGEHNPSGHLPFTWYRGDEQLGELGDYDIRPHEGDPGRTYRYFQGEPSYSFGHGLSYGDFDYGELRVDRGSVDANGAVTARTTITNRSDTAGSDVVQLYSSSQQRGGSSQQRGGDDPRPDKRLADFQKVRLKPGESTEVAFRVPVRELAFFDEQQNRYTVDDAYELQLGRSSADVADQQRVDVTGELAPQPESVSVTPQAAGDPEGSNASRVMYAPGTDIDPRPTVAMSDGTRRGYDAEGTAAQLPPGMRISYESNRPDVVQVDDNGVRARSAGVATVTATVEHRGQTQRTSFAVHVGNGA
ncbi:glycoside hydrolase family 3 C-terminal domain-containing protein [Salinifilum ghardaiensis]